MAEENAADWGLDWDELADLVDALRRAGHAVVAAWETGDLAAAVNELDAVLNATKEDA